ncbi:hypothetical protein M9Y10_032569 [Tritrichomonas musculus]|uniref:Uncharacterized protein n=1 Tax=Tritrichomonas musculus TaxID=1915356 RepID=A0ABR2GYS0_9EUKA
MKGKKNHRYKILIADREHTKAFCEINTDKLDAIKMQNIIRKIIGILDQYKLNRYQNFGDFLKAYKFDAPQQIEMIFQVITYLKKNPPKNPFKITINKRDIKKTDVEKRNIILTAISMEHPDELIAFMTIYIQNHLNINEQEEFIKGFKSMINNAQNDSLMAQQNNLLNINQNNNLESDNTSMENDTGQINEISVFKNTNDSNLSSPIFENKEENTIDEDVNFFENFSDMDETLSYF